MQNYAVRSLLFPTAISKVDTFTFHTLGPNIKLHFPQTSLCEHTHWSTRNIRVFSTEALMLWRGHSDNSQLSYNDKALGVN